MIRALSFYLVTVALSASVWLPGELEADEFPCSCGESLSTMLETVTPAVVTIRVSKPAVSPFSFGNQLPDELRRFFDQWPDSQRSPEGPGNNLVTGAGSGVIIDSDQGLIVTNHHVVDDASEISVVLEDRRVFTARLLGSDASTDIALVKIDAQGLAELGFADIETVRVGDSVVAIGNPFGVGQTVTAGIVSALGRSGLNASNYEDFIQTDAAINMGNSGGALVNLNGQLIGINTAIISGSGGSNGIGFAVPVDMMSVVVEQLEKNGEIRRGMLGIQIIDVTPQIEDALDLDTGSGALVTAVVPDSAAEKAGVEVSDVIVEIDGEEVSSARVLRNVVGLKELNQDIQLVVDRNGERLTLQATIGDVQGQAGNQSLTPNQPVTPANFLGAELRNSSDSDVGVDVVSVQPQSRAWNSGLREGDRITAINKKTVADLAQFNQAVEESQGVTALTVIRDGREMLLLIAA